ncbi:hypothetical protein KEJ15_00830 [Candidatus Bathyarchaeota archaeon]|nr:hypothetical protein [Candidatus Bathyarchaeota archaeon]
MVQIVDAYKPRALLKSFVCESQREKEAASRYVIGDSFVVKAECERVDKFDLRFYLNSSLVCEKQGGIYGETLVIVVPLLSPEFKAGNVYGVVLDVYSFNSPLPGVFYSDSSVFVFEVTGAETQIGLVCGYDESSRCLSLSANLTDRQGYPVVNETVDFYLQFSNRHRVSDGWFPVGSVNTSSCGLAEFSLALNVSAGNYSVRACHEGNENFGKSEDVVDFEVLGNETVGNLGEGKHGLLSEGGEVIIVVENIPPLCCASFKDLWLLSH